MAHQRTRNWHFLQGHSAASIAVSPRFGVRMPGRLLVPAIVAVLAVAARAAEPPPPACATPAHRAFDFWLGTWDVDDASGKPAGRNRITRVHGGCALMEQWEGRGGLTGTSLNALDAASGRWHQTWVDSAGNLLRFDGGPVGGGMRLEGEAADDERPQARVRHRIEWTPQADGRVRQHWQQSKDGGATWLTVFDGWYRRVP
jgi:hypothetical protein